MVLVFTVDDGTGQAIVYWYQDWSNLPPETVVKGTQVDAGLLVAPEVEPWQDVRPYLTEGGGVEWRVADKEASDTAHLFRQLRELEPAVHGVDPWVAPTGVHDAPNDGDHRWHDGRVWRSTINGNTVEPGTHPGFDWWVEVAPPAVPDVLRQPLAALRPQVEQATDVVGVRDALLAVLDVLTGAE